MSFDPVARRVPFYAPTLFKRRVSHANRLTNRQLTTSCSVQTVDLSQSRRARQLIRRVNPL